MSISDQLFKDVEDASAAINHCKRLSHEAAELAEKQRKVLEALGNQVEANRDELQTRIALKEIARGFWTAELQPK